MAAEARSQKARMLAGEFYDPADAELLADRERAVRLIHRYNRSAADDPAGPTTLRDLLGELGPGSVIRAPFYCDYGYNIRIGAETFFNYGCVLLDVTSINVGRLCQFGPYVQLLTADHPRKADLRRQGLECARPITIGDNVWVGAGALILPGVTVGEDAIVAAGAVVTRDVPAGAIVGGTPARRLRREDSDQSPT